MPEEIKKETSLLYICTCQRSRRGIFPPAGTALPRICK